ncbi:MAG: acetylornithine transaminase [Capsulimonadaceae bacterium]|nr:acetylornithine transaminase [Capsulimonadaceae bacterium]
MTTEMLDKQKTKLEESEVSLASVKAADDAYVIHTYGRLPVCFVRGEGLRLWDDTGKEYLDFLGGIAVNALGHCHPRVVKAIQDQAATLIHTSNLYYTVPQARLAKKMIEISGFDRVFFCNSGAEANEAALKIARKAGKAYSTDKIGIITATHSFHGRTMGTVTATAQAKYQDPFRPLVPGFSYVERNDSDALRLMVNDNTCAILLEPIQGECGIHALTDEFLQTARELADRYKALLIFDEVQCGMGRTGDWWAFQATGVVPDLFTSAKALGSGLPIGACVARGRAAETLVPGDHGSTFAANPLATTAAYATICAIQDEGLLENASEMGRYFKSRLMEAAGPRVTEVRGRGLMLGVQLAGTNARSVMLNALEKGLIVNAIGDSTIRLLPAYIVTRAQIDKAVEILVSVM